MCRWMSTGIFLADKKPLDRGVECSGLFAHRSPTDPTDNSLNEKSVACLCKGGFGLLETLISVLVAGIAIVGALEVSRSVQKQTSESAGQNVGTAYARDRVFAVFDGVAKRSVNVDTVTDGLTSVTFRDLGWALSDGVMTESKRRTRAGCVVGTFSGPGTPANPNNSFSGDGNYRITFPVGALSLDASSGAFGCPTASQWSDYVQTLNALESEDGQQRKLYFAFAEIGRLCAATLDSGSSPTNYIWLIEDESCLFRGGSMIADLSDVVYLPYVTAMTANPNPKTNHLQAAIFHTMERTTEPLVGYCGITDHLRDTDMSFDIDGDGEDDRQPFATVTISTGFRDDEDFLTLTPGVRSFSASFNPLTYDDQTNICDPSITTAQFGIGSNSVDDEIHKYCNIAVTLDGGGSYSLHARYNASSGFMLLRAQNGSTNPTEDEWSEIFNQVSYMNVFDADDDVMTVPTTVDREFVFSLGELPARFQDGDVHFYDFDDCDSISTANRASSCIDWLDAFNEASGASMRHLGLTGYLATATSQEENDFMSQRARSGEGVNETFAAGWLGGRDKINRQGSGDNNYPDQSIFCPDVTGAARGEARWYWVTGKEGDELCTQFWDGSLGNGQPLLRNGTITQDDDPNAANYAQPITTMDWICDADNNFTTNDLWDNRALSEVVWGNGASQLCDGRRNNTAACSGGAFSGKTDTYRYANWSGYGNTACFYAFNPNRPNVNTSNNRITGLPGHGLTDGDPLLFNAGGGAVIGGLVDGGTYFAVVESSDQFSLASTQANAIARTGVIDLTTTGNDAMAFRFNRGYPKNNIEPNNDSNIGDVLQMTGQQGGRGQWNDLVGFSSQQLTVASYYYVRGYFVEYHSAQDNGVRLARRKNINVARQMQLCDEGEQGLGFDLSWRP